MTMQKKKKKKKKKKKIFFGELYNYKIPISPFTVQNFLKDLLADPRVMKMCNSPKWPISPNEIIFRKPVSEPCFFHLCLSTCQK